MVYPGCGTGPGVPCPVYSLPTLSYVLPCPDPDSPEVNIYTRFRQKVTILGFSRLPWASRTDQLGLKTGSNRER